jgi:hypothetical protein
MNLARSSHSLARTLLTRRAISSASASPSLIIDEEQTSVQLIGLPTSALPADVRRMAERIGVAGGFEGTTIIIRTLLCLDYV